MGPPGSGKGTQASGIAKKLNVESVSTGDLFRSHQTRQTELGILAATYMERGEYVPDAVTIKIIMDWIVHPKRSKGFVLDGFPRTKTQAETLDKELCRYGGVDRVLLIDAPEVELVRRLTGRLSCKDCQATYHVDHNLSSNNRKCEKCEGRLYRRSDDNSIVAKKRIQLYRKETSSVVEHYREIGKLKEINGAEPMDTVAKNLLEAVE